MKPSAHGTRIKTKRKMDSDVSKRIQCFQSWIATKIGRFLLRLVGGGQEIHSGEAGLAEWGKTLREKFPAVRKLPSHHWQLEHDSSTAGHRLFADGNKLARSTDSDRAIASPESKSAFIPRPKTYGVGGSSVAGDATKAAAIVPRIARLSVHAHTLFANCPPMVGKNTRAANGTGRIRGGSRCNRFVPTI